MHTRTATSITVQPIRLVELEAHALAYVLEGSELRPALSPKATECKAGHAPHGFVETPKGLYALCEEGVGDGPITKGHKYNVDFYPGGHDESGKGRWFSMMPQCTIKLDPDELKALAEGEPVNLADFIRVFGHRLDQNYEDWRRTLGSTGTNHG